MTAPPRWVLGALWRLHRAGDAISGGRLGLRSGSPEGLGAWHLHTTERATLWGRFVARLADYERYADSADREIPIVILEPIDKEAHA